jgi:hypothetical protein
MAQLFTRKQLILAKIETTYGTDSVPVVGTDAMLISDLSMNPSQSEYVNRDLIRPYLGASQQLPAAIRSEVSFTVELAGSGAAGTAPKWAPLIRACGFAETVNAGVSVQYDPVSGPTFASVTIYAFRDGVRHVIRGARGTFTIAMNNRERPVMNFTFTGLYQSPTDVTPGTAVYTGWQTPLVFNNQNSSAFTLQSYANAVLSSITIDAGNQVEYRSFVGTGGESILITNREVTGQITIESATQAEKDYWVNVRDAVTGNFTITHGTTAGNRVVISAPAVQVTEPQYGDVQGISTTQFNARLTPSATAGNDEIRILVN